MTDYIILLQTEPVLVLLSETPVFYRFAILHKLSDRCAFVCYIHVVYECRLITSLSELDELHPLVQIRSLKKTNMGPTYYS